MSSLNKIELGEDFTPSLMLAEMKNQGAEVKADNALIKRIWISRLPANVNSHTAADITST